MKSFVIYLTVFFIVTTYIRGFLGLDRYRFYENPYLAEKLKHISSENRNSKFANKKFVHSKKALLEEPEVLLDYSSILHTKLQPIEQKYLKEGINKHLAKEWFSKDPSREKFKLSVAIKKHDISIRRNITTHKGKRYYHLRQKSIIRIYYKVFNSKGVLITKGYIPYHVIVKALSHWDFIESERLAKKSLFLRIGEKIANSLNSKRFYILNRSNISKL